MCALSFEFMDYFCPGTFLDTCTYSDADAQARGCFKYKTKFLGTNSKIMFLKNKHTYIYINILCYNLQIVSFKAL